MALSDYFFLYLLTALGTGLVAWYAYSNKKHLSHMCCTMLGMVFGGVPALAIGTIYALETGDFVWSMIYGTIAGYAVGVPAGRLGGGLGRMEAVFAAPSAGFMGGMLGVMVKIYDVKLFTIFFMFVVFALLGEMAYVIHKDIASHKQRASA